MLSTWCPNRKQDKNLESHQHHAMAQIAPKKRDPLPNDLKEFVALCRSGKLFAVQQWINSGKSCRWRAGNFGSRPLGVAVEKGFHSLMEVLLRTGVDQDEKDWALSYAVSSRRLDLIELLVEYGADPNSISFDEVICCRHPQIIRWFIEQGVDLETDWPIAQAFKYRHREFLGIYMGLRDTFPSARLQAAMALRIHAREGNLKWVSLLMWAGADPRWIVPDLEHDPPNENLGSALEDAVKYSRIEIVKKIGIDPARDNPSALLGECWMCTSPELVRLLIEAGADPNSDIDDRNPMQALMQNFEWSLDSRFSSHDSRGAIECLKIAAAAGGRWRPNNENQLRYFRRAIAKTSDYSAVEYLRELIDCGAIEQQIFAELMRTPRMKQILTAGIPGVVRLREFAGIRKGMKRSRDEIHRFDSGPTVITKRETSGGAPSSPTSTRFSRSEV
jgi:ankyrin repeat protein